MSRGLEKKKEKKTLNGQKIRDLHENLKGIGQRNYLCSVLAGNGYQRSNFILFLSQNFLKNLWINKTWTPKRNERN